MIYGKNMEYENHVDKTNINEKHHNHNKTIYPVLFQVRIRLEAMTSLKVSMEQPIHS